MNQLNRLFLLLWLIIGLVGVVFSQQFQPLPVNNYTKTSELQIVYRLSYFLCNPDCEKDILSPFFLIHRTPVAIDEFKENSSLATVAPNPSDGYITVRTKELSRLTIALFDLSGRMVMKTGLMSDERLYVGNLPQACYLLHVYESDGRLLWVEKLIIVR